MGVRFSILRCLDGSTRSATVMEWQHDDEAIAMLALVLNEEDEEQVVATVSCSVNK